MKSLLEKYGPNTIFVASSAIPKDEYRKYYKSTTYDRYSPFVWKSYITGNDSVTKDQPRF